MIMLSIGAYANSNDFNNHLDNSCSLLDSDQDDWEFLGRITAVSEGGSTETFNLFVKVIANKAFYQVREKNGSKIYSVTFGDYTVGNKKYNAKFTAGSGFLITYYLNL